MRHQIQPDRSDSLTLVLGEAVVMPEKVESRLHRREHLVDWRLSGVVRSTFPGRAHDEGPRSFVGQQHVDVAHGATAVDLLANEVPPLVVFYCSRGPTPARARCGARRLALLAR